MIMDTIKLCHTERSISGITADDNENIYYTTANEHIYILKKDDKEPRVLVNIYEARLEAISWNNNIIYLYDDKHNQILSYHIDTGRTHIILESPQRGFKNGHFTRVHLWDINGITVSKDGHLYISDSHYIRRIDLTKKISQKDRWIQRERIRRR